MKINSHSTESTANVLTARYEAKPPPDLVLWDNTMREGEQPPGVAFSADEKFAIAEALDEFGVRWASIGFPAVSKEELESCRRITRAGFKMKTGVLSRMVEGDLVASAESGADLVGLFIGGSDTHLRDKLRMTEKDASVSIERSCRRARELGLRVGFGVEDASRTPLARLLRMSQIAVDAGAEFVAFSDTTGILTPTSTKRIVRILDVLLQVPINLHFHNDFGLALANTLAGIEAGARIAQGTINGGGERAGNACTEELAVVLKVKYGLDLGLKLENLDQLCALVHKASGTESGPHKPITGKWCFTHESGIHVAGVLANPETYQPFPPELVGRHHEIVFGKHSGGQGVSHLADQNHLTLSESGRKDVLQRIKTSAEKKQGIVDDRTVLEWIREAMG